MLKENPYEKVKEKLTMAALFGSLSEEQKVSLKKYYTTGEQDKVFDDLKDNKKFFISLGVASVNEGIKDEELKVKVLSQLG